MDIVRMRIPSHFIAARTRLGWHEVRFGLDHELLDPAAVAALTIDDIKRSEPCSDVLQKFKDGLSSQTIDDLENLSEPEPEPCKNDLRDKWLYLVLAWIYENKDTIGDPLQRIEEVYADFDYPGCIEGFVRYMPMAGPDLGSREANEARLFRRWKQYLEEAASKESLR